MKKLREHILDTEDQREAMAALPDRVNDLRQALTDIRAAVTDFRDDCKRRFDALVKESPNGDLTARAGRLGATTWISIAALIVVPIVTTLLAKG